MLSHLRATGKVTLVLVILLTGITPFSLAGQTVVHGKVTDALTFEPIVFANVIFKNTTIGVQTEFNGNFILSGVTTSDSVTISFIGYETKTIEVRLDTIQKIDVQLNPALYSLPEIRVTPGENPAHAILRKIWNSMESNSIDRLSSYQYKNYSRSTVYFRKFGDKPDEKRVLKPFEQEFMEYAMKTGEDNIPAIPSYLTESISEEYYLKSPKRKFTSIKATNSRGIAFENTDLVAQLVNKQENIYFNDNNVIIVDKSFVSPVSRLGLMYYRYYLVDSLYIDNKYYCYEINVVPRREEDPCFHGTIWVNDTTWALKRISVEVTKKAEVNFIQRLKIQQDYELISPGAWFPVKTRIMADAVNVFVTNYSEKSDIVANQPFDLDFYGSELKLNFAARDYSQDYWEINRPDSLDATDKLASQMIDSLAKNKKITNTAKLIEASIRGYYNLGWFEVGPYLLAYNYNDVEGSRFRVGGRTNESFSNTVIMEGYLAYGTRDRQFKGSVQSEFIIAKEYWTKIGFQYRDDVENLGSLDEFYSGSSFLTFATTFGGSDKMDKSRVLRVWMETDLLKGLTGKIVLTSKTFEPVSPDFYFGWYTDDARTTVSSDFKTSELAFIMRYQPRATYVLDGVRRFPVNFNKYPVLRIGYFRGFEDLFEGDFGYRKIIADISHDLNLGGIGTLGYDLRFTKIFDQLPYPILITLAGNQTIFRSDRTYNQMNYGEFVLDEAFEVFVAYHMNGLILNKIPLLKKLEWRTVITAHAAFGSFDEKKNGIYDPLNNPDGILADSIDGNPLTPFNTLAYDKPYAELSYGIENIFRFLRVDLVHRLSWLENPGTQRFAITVSGVFRF